MCHKSIRTSIAFLTVFFSFSVLSQPSLQAEEPYQVEWIRQIGTSSSDSGYGIAADEFGGIYVTGDTNGDLAGTNFGRLDAFLLKYDLDGNQIWRRQLGTGDLDASRGVAVDGAGHIYFGGATFGSLGGPFGGDRDIFLARYEQDGAHTWTRQFGDAKREVATAVAADNLGNVFFAGTVVGTAPAFGQNGIVGKYSAQGVLDWTDEFGFGFSRTTQATGAAADGLGNVLVTGFTEGDSSQPMEPGDWNVFLAKYDMDGNQVWGRHIESDETERASAIALDAFGNSYITGDSGGSLLVSKYDPDGTHVWTDTSLVGVGFGIAVDIVGNVYITGQARPSTVGDEIFVAKYSSDGAMLWDTSFGSDANDRGFGVSLDGMGNLYVTGETGGELFGANAGAFDVFVARLSPVPEPGTIFMWMLGIAAASLFVRARKGQRHMKTDPSAK
jgi:hypothetical protein